MTNPIRVFIAAEGVEDRATLVAHLAGDPRWVLVSDAERADVVLTSAEAWRRRRGATRLAPARPREVLVEALTARELEVLRQAADGLHNREIATNLGVTEHTVKFHLAAVFGKLGASTRTEAVQRGLRLGLLEI